MRIALKAATDKFFRQGTEKGRALLPGTEGHRYLHDSSRCLAQALNWPTRVVVDKVCDFHAERLEAVPDLTRYAELRGYRDLLFEEYRGMASVGVDAEAIALAVS